MEDTVFSIDIEAAKYIVEDDDFFPSVNGPRKCLA
jgi:hypothetical protein